MTSILWVNFIVDNGGSLYSIVLCNVSSVFVKQRNSILVIYVIHLMTHDIETLNIILKVLIDRVGTQLFYLQSRLYDYHGEFESPPNH
jgi:hypothetical protein